MLDNSGFDSKIETILTKIQKLDEVAIACSSYFSVIISIITFKLILDNFSINGAIGSIFLTLITFFTINFLTNHGCLDFRSLHGAKLTLLTVIAINLVIIVIFNLNLIFFFYRDNIFIFQSLIISLAILNLNYYVRIKRHKTNMLPTPNETIRLKIDSGILAFSGLFTSFCFILLNYTHIKQIYSMFLFIYLIGSLFFYIFLYVKLSAFLIRVKENKIN